MNLTILYIIATATIWLVAAWSLVQGNLRGSTISCHLGWFVFIGAIMFDFMVNNGAYTHEILHPTQRSTIFMEGLLIVTGVIGGISPMIVNGGMLPSKEKETNYSQGVSDILRKAREITEKFGTNYIGTEHLLLGFLETQGQGSSLLSQLHLDTRKANAYLSGAIPKHDVSMTGSAPYTPRAKKVLILAHKEATKRKNEQVEPIHVILGLLRDGDGIGYQALARQDMTYENVSKLVS